MLTHCRYPRVPPQVSIRARSVLDLTLNARSFLHISHGPVPDARDIADELTAKGVKLSMNGSVYDPADPVGKLLFTTLSMVAEFEADLIAARTREGMAIAKAKGRLKGKKPKLGPAKEKHLVQLHAAGTHTVAELCELFDVTRSTVYRAIDRQRDPALTAGSA